MRTIMEPLCLIMMPKEIMRIQTAFFFANNSYIVFTGDVNGQNHIAFKNLHNIIDLWVTHGIVGYNNTRILF